MAGGTTRRAALAAAVWILYGCGASPLEGDEDGQKVLKWMQAPPVPAKGLRASASFMEKTPKGVMRGEAFLFFRQPSDMRIEILGAADLLVAVFVSRGGRSLLLDYYNGKAYSSEDGACLFSRLLGTEVALPQFMGIVMGQPPLIRFDATHLEASPAGYSILTLMGDEGKMVEKLQVVSGVYGVVPLRAVVLRDGKKFVDMSFRERGWTSGISPLVPRVIEIGFVKEQMQVLWQYKKVVMNPDLPDELFDLAAPGGFDPEVVECR